MRILTVAIVLSLAAKTHAATIIPVDFFDAGPISVTAPAGGSATQAVQPGLPVLGGTRKIDVSSITYLAFTPNPVTFSVVPPMGFHSGGSTTNGETVLTYDAGGPHDLLIDAFGIIGTAETTFVLFDFALASGLTITATAVDSDADVATTSFTSGIGVIPPDLEVTVVFADWIPAVGNTGAVDFDKISSISFSVYAPVGSDFVLNSIVIATTIPEPTSLAILGTLCGLALVIRRKRS
jgi:hypothetical protein